MDKPYKHPRICPYLTCSFDANLASLGSSQVGRLLSGTLDVHRVHKRVAYSGCHVEARFWEELVGENPNTYVEAGAVGMIPQPFARSKTFPWLVANPDFICKVKRNNYYRTILVEVKSKKTHTLPTNDDRNQVRAALECFGLEEGLLITFDNTKKTPFEFSTETIRNDLDLDFLERQYAKFLSKAAVFYYDDRVDPDIIAGVLSCFRGSERETVTYEKAKKLEKERRVNSCAYNKRMKGKGRTFLLRMMGEFKFKLRR